MIGFETCAGKGSGVTPVSEPATIVVGSATEVDDEADEDETRYQEDCKRKMRSKVAIKREGRIYV